MHIWCQLELVEKPKIFKTAIETISKTLLPLYLDPRVQKLA